MARSPLYLFLGWISMQRMPAFPIVWTVGMGVMGGASSMSGRGKVDIPS